MERSMQARELLTRAKELYDDPDLPFAEMARRDGWRSGFESGAAWMRAVISHLRGEAIPPNNTSYNQLGILKYGLATIAALMFSGLIIWLQWWLLLPGLILVFYAVEAQMVFLFPVAIDNHPHLLSRSRSLMVYAGGTLPVMVTVMQLAAIMLFGGFFGNGFVRSWALGCLSVLLWYEDVKHAADRVTR